MFLDSFNRVKLLPLMRMTSYGRLLIKCFINLWVWPSIEHVLCILYNSILSYTLLLLNAIIFGYNSGGCGESAEPN